MRLPSVRRVSQLLGIDTRAHEFCYSEDARFGLMASAKRPDRWVKTTCGYCSVGCGMLIGSRQGRLVAVKGDPEHPVNRGTLCPKGLSEHHTLEAKNRAQRPLVRKRGDKLVPIGWEEAIARFVREVGVLQRNYGPDSFAILSTGQLVTEELYTLGKLARVGMGVRHYDGNTTLCMASAVAGYKRSFGSDGPPGCYADLETADVVVLIGANIADNHPILARRLLANRGPCKQIIVVDPRVTKTAMLADLFLPIKPRKDVFLLNGLAHLLIAHGLVDRRFVDDHTTGFAELEQHLECFTLPQVARATGLPEAKLLAVARAIGQAKRVSFAWTMGVNHSTQGTETVNAINNLALLTGNVGRPGATAFSITGQCNAMGSREASFTSSMPGYRRYESRRDRQELAELWGLDSAKLPTERGLAYPDIIQGIVAGRIKGLWVIGTNPMVSCPDRIRLRRALRKLEFLVVQDGYHPTPTSELAHLVLPAAIWGEKEGTYTSSERRVSRVNKGASSPAQARADFEIFLTIAHELGCDHSLFPGWTRPRDAFEEWRRVSQGRLCDYSGISYEKLERGSMQWPAPVGAEVGQERLYRDGRFATDDGKARLFVVDCESPPEEPDDQYPLLLNTGRTVEHWHTRTKTSGVEILERRAPEAWVEISPADAARLDIRASDWVSVESRRGRIPRVRAKVTATVAEGQVFIPFHYVEAPANNLTVDAACPIAREPNFKQCAVRIARC